MEAFAAISLTGNILQFLEVITKLVSSSHEIIESGNTKEYIELETVAQELQGFSTRLSIPKSDDSGPKTPEEQSLRVLASDCVGVTTDLLSALNKIRSNNQQSKIRSFYAALKAELKKDQIERLQKRLDSISRSIVIHMSAANQQKLFRKLEDLHRENRSLDGKRGDDIEELRKDVQRLVRRGEGGKLTLTGEVRHPDSLLAVAHRGFKYSAEFVVLDQLRFDKINDRYDLIEAAHKHTLSWVYQEEKNVTCRNEPSDFREWLTSSNDLYWISGKPGSGKSTLMKHLYASPVTTELLKEWTQGKRLIILSYFFWNASPNSPQKSQEGLLRTLIYQILRECPELIHEVYPHIYSKFESGEMTLENQMTYHHEGFPMDAKSLISILEHASVLLTKRDIKLCCFVDGLDECDGNLDELLGCIDNIQRLNNAKICVSSRPWNEFKAVFGRDNSKQLQMQDFNDTDIKNYVKDKLEMTEDFQRLEATETEGQKLIQEVLDASNGVFLWIILVVKSLNHGIMNGDSFRTLRHRLSTYPNDLDGFFRAILESHVGAFYRQRAAQWFSVVLNAAVSLPAGLLWFIDFGEDPNVLRMKTKQLDQAQVEARLSDMEKRLDASCKGLLEMTQRVANLPLINDQYFYRQVEFLHRTVKDFLIQPGTQSLLESWDTSDFNLHRAVCIAIIGYLKSAPISSSDYKRPIISLFRAFFMHLQQLDTPDDSESLEIALLRSFAAVIGNSDDNVCHEILCDVFASWIEESIDDTSMLRIIYKFPSHIVPHFKTWSSPSRGGRFYSALVYLALIDLNVDSIQNLVPDTVDLSELRLRKMGVWELFWKSLDHKHNLSAQSDPHATFDGISQDRAKRLMRITKLGFDRGCKVDMLVVCIDGKLVNILDISKRLLPPRYHKKLLNVRKMPPKTIMSIEPDENLLNVPEKTPTHTESDSRPSVLHVQQHQTEELHISDDSVVSPPLSKARRAKLRQSLPSMRSILQNFSRKRLSRPSEPNLKASGHVEAST